MVEVATIERLLPTPGRGPGPSSTPGPTLPAPRDGRWGGGVSKVRLGPTASRPCPCPCSAAIPAPGSRSGGPEGGPTTRPRRLENKQQQARSTSAAAGTMTGGTPMTQSARAEGLTLNEVAQE